MSLNSVSTKEHKVYPLESKVPSVSTKTVILMLSVVVTGNSVYKVFVVSSKVISGFCLNEGI